MPAISPDRWRAVSPFLDKALELTHDDRAAWLASLGARDAALAADLRMLLEVHEALHGSGFLEHAPAPAHAASSLSLAGQTLGAYRLTSRIGQGGMGSVWLAERSDGRFEGRAAIKLLNVALMGRAGEERFRREGHFLARLTHPNIARLVDAGVSPAGQPYLILEHVDGKGIDRHCDEHALGIDARLRLFLDVLEAVAHAHASLIVHRDLKPANVLVSVEGQVKLLDFGIAKLLQGDAEWGDERPAEASTLTRDGGAALTPEYAAPEQVTGGPVTTATDVYALGVLLYVLLSGQHPSGPAGRSAADLLRAIVDTEPGRLSDAVVSRTETPQALARHATRCGTTPGRLRRALQGDLDTIVAKALKKDALERYASVTALAEDLRRFLHHEPISARPDTLRYRTATFLRRNVRGVAATAAIVVLVGGLTGFHASRLATERDYARLEAEKASRVSELLTGLLTGADPYATPATRGEPTVRGLLDAGAERVRKELMGQPELQAEMMTVIGRVYQRLGLYDKAQPLLEQALALGRGLTRTDHARVAQSLNDLGALLREKGNHAAAGPMLEEALGMRRRLLGREHKDVAVTLVELGRDYSDRGLDERAEPLFREALAIRRKVLGETHRETAASLSGLGLLLRQRGDLARAEPLLLQAMAISRHALGVDHANVATAMSNVALIAEDLGDHAAAESMYRQALAILRRAVGETHRSIAMTLSSLSHPLREQGKYDEAAASLREAMTIAQATMDSEHPFAALLMINVARVHLARGEAAAAAPLLEQALEMRGRAFPEDDWRIAETKSLLGASLTALARYPEAEPLLIDAHNVLKDLPGVRGREAGETVTRLVALYDAWGHADKAEAYRMLLPSRSRTP